MHVPGKQQPLYGSVPYVLGLSKHATQSVAWVNSAHTFVEIEQMNIDKREGSFISFVSEGGALEFFTYATK